MIGIPVKLMHENVHHFVTIELKTGDQFFGYLA
jgi:small nuclear ribonucleoprotein D3